MEAEEIAKQPPPDTAEKPENDQQLPPQATVTTTDINALRASVRESTSRLQFPETGEWATEDLENIETAEDLSPEQWGKIFRINKVLYGFTIREPENDIVKARQQAFVQGPAASAQDEILTGIPEFEVCDSSSISIKQIKTDLQRSLAENGFSAKSIGTALGGGAFGVTAGISASLKAETSQTNVVGRDKAEMEYYAAYNFPRARLFLDEDNLALSPQCQRALVEIQRDPTDERLRKFSEKFACQLGGQLQSSKFAGSLSEIKDVQKQDALKSEMGMNFGAQYASGSVTYGKQRQTGSQNLLGGGLDISSLAWTARGGNSLLCANPPGWARSVANPKHWRVIEQEKVVTLHELIGRFENWKSVPRLFEDIAQQRIKPSTPNKQWRGRFRLEMGNKRLAWSDLQNQSLIVTDEPPEDGPPEPVFTVLSANMDDQRSAPLPADYPLYLFARASPARDPSRNNQYQGIFVDGLGRLKPEQIEDKMKQVTRFSLRLAGQRGRWGKATGQSLKTIQSGDHVNLYCHSLGFGPYARDQTPPTHSIPVTYSPQEQTVQIQPRSLGFRLSPNHQQIIRQYDEGTLDVTDRKAFEQKGYLDRDDQVGSVKLPPGLGAGNDRQGKFIRSIMPRKLNETMPSSDELATSYTAIATREKLELAAAVVPEFIDTFTVIFE